MRFLLIISMFLLCGKSFAQGAKIIFKAETIDYGKIIHGKDSGERTFEFKNAGNQPLVIINIGSTCGCATSSIAKKVFLPGESGSFKAKYDTSRNGKFSKTFTLKSNATNYINGDVVLTIKGDVISK